MFACSQSAVSSAEPAAPIVVGADGSVTPFGRPHSGNAVPGPLMFGPSPQFANRKSACTPAAAVDPVFLTSATRVLSAVGSTASPGAVPAGALLSRAPTPSQPSNVAL